MHGERVHECVVREEARGGCITWKVIMDGVLKEHLENIEIDEMKVIDAG